MPEQLIGLPAGAGSTATPAGGGRVRRGIARLGSLRLTLTLFHLALIALLLLAALGRLSYLKARIEIAEGQQFDGVPVEVEQGPWHPYRLDRIGLVNERVAIDYSAATTTRRTSNDVRWRDPAGYWQRSVLRENEPLELLGYRIHVSGGKGFAPHFAWSPASARPGDEPILGSVHLPRFPSDPLAQQTEWTLPDGKTAAWVTLRFDQAPLAGERRYELRPGEAIVLPGGRLEYQGLKLWMGYLVHYDWTVPWLFAAAMLATLALGAHFLSRFGRSAW